MTREQMVLAALAAGGDGAAFSPVQAQKLFFLIDRELAAFVDGPHFDFQPYDYGPFDRMVYQELERLSHQGLAEIERRGHYRIYRLSGAGLEQGRAALNLVGVDVRQYLAQLATWVRSLSFQQLVAAIYNRYPEMKVNSVFRE
jgi:hypothetical protein